VSLWLVALGGALALAGGWSLVSGGRDLQLVYHILTNDPIDVRELVHRDGPVELRGTARPDTDRPESDQLIRAPVSETPCLVYEYEAQERRSSGQSSHWRTLDEGHNAISFFLTDDTGSVQVRPTGAELHLEEHTVRVPGGEEPPERIAQYISETDEIDFQQNTLDLRVTEIEYGNDQRFIERRVDPGESVHVYGVVESAPAGDWGSDQVPARVAEGIESPLVISDGSERETAWRVARRPLARTVGGIVLLVPGLLALAVGLLSL
jgi:hypothetical protein